MGLSALAWLLTSRLSMGSSMVPGLVPGGGDRGMGTIAIEAPLFFGMWVTMMVAMMFPSVSPMVVSYWRMSRTRNQPRTGLAVFIGGYLIVWAAMGAAAYLLYLTILWAAPSLTPRAAALAGGTVLALSGAYQLSRYKTVCLRQLRETFPRVVGPEVFQEKFLSLWPSAWDAP